MIVVLIEDQALLRSTLITALSQLPEYHLAAYSDKASDAVQLCRAHHPDLVIMDIFTSDGNGIDCAAEVKRLFPAVKVMILTGVEDDRLVQAAEEAGADLFAYKSLSLEEFVQLLGNAGKPYRIFPTPKAAGTDHPVFTQLEIQMLELLAKGRTSREIASELFLGYGTVRVYISRMYAATGMKTRAQLVAYAITNNVIKP